MRLGDKPLADMSESEMLEAISYLRDSREALRAEAIAKKREKDKGNFVKEPRQPRAKKEIDPTMTDMLAFLQGGGEVPKQ